MIVPVATSRTYPLFLQVSPPDRFTGTCRRIAGNHVFRYRPLPGSRTPREYPPNWGTHLVDVDLGLGNLTRIVQLQTRTWLSDAARR